MRRWPIVASAIAVLGVLSGAAAYQHVAPRDGERHGAWQEIAWPFPRDGWPAGKAFRCGTGACGGEVELYVRPKIGFCNCDSGVADDDEVDRVADLDLLSEHFAPLAPGQTVRLADLAGRIRAYDIKMAGGSRHTAIGVAVSHRYVRTAARGAGLSGDRRNDALGDGCDGRAVVAALLLHPASAGRGN